MCIVYLGLPYIWKLQLYKRIFDTTDIGYVEKYIYNRKQNIVFKAFRCSTKDLLALNEKTHIINGTLLWTLMGQDIDSTNYDLIVTNNLHLHYRVKRECPTTDKIIPQNAEILIFPYDKDKQG